MFQVLHRIVRDVVRSLQIQGRKRSEILEMGHTCVAELASSRGHGKRFQCRHSTEIFQSFVGVKVSIFKYKVLQRIQLAQALQPRMGGARLDLQPFNMPKVLEQSHLPIRKIDPANVQLFQRIELSHKFHPGVSVSLDVNCFGDMHAAQTRHSFGEVRDLDIGIEYAAHSEFDEVRVAIEMTHQCRDISDTEHAESFDLRQSREARESFIGRRRDAVDGQLRERFEIFEILKPGSIEFHRQ